MKSIEPFINLGWYTVPLKGKLERLEDGKKTVPHFKSGWKEHYQQHFNEVKSKLGGVITGECSDIIAIDCDNTDTYHMFRAFDPSYEFVFVSEGKGYEAGTFIYKFNPDMPFTFSVQDGDIALDVYANNGFVYLPTEANKTKVPFTDIPEIKEIPAAALALLKSLHTLKNKVTVAPAQSSIISTSNCLAPLVEQFTKAEEFMPGLFRILTPKDFRSEEEYVKEGYLHPKNVPSGRGSEYLSKISAILGKDPSVSRELYVEAMNLINSLWDDPIEEDRLDKTILDPMITGKAKIGNVSIWQYDKEWKKHRYVLNTKRQSNIELGFDDRRASYYCVDILNQHIKVFSRDQEFQAYIDAVAVNAPNKKEMKRGLPLLNVISNPSLSFGFHEGDIKTLNTFIQTPELNVLNNPNDYRELYTRPETTLKYFENLVPDEMMRNYLLAFTKRKLLTFEYSPTVLYFMGVHGSGKDTYVSILERIIGDIPRPTVKEFQEKNNYWMVDAYFAQLDEYGNQLTRISDKEEVLGKLKAYTGKPQVQIRKMRTDGFPYLHSITFVMTANKNPLMLEDGDRRIAFFSTPNKLEAQKWVIDAGGGSVVWNKIMSEVKDFCYYLATEVEMLSSQEYISPPDTEDKLSLIADSMFPANRIAYALKHRMWDYLRELAAEHGVDEIKAGIRNKKLTEDHLSELYDAMTDMNGDIKALNKCIRNMGIEIVSKNIAGNMQYYYNVFPDSPFEDEENE